MSVSEALPDYHFRERHSVHVAASPGHALAAARAVTLDDVPLVRALFRLRGLRAASRGPLWNAMAAEGFAPYGDDTLVAVGRPWSPRSRLRHVDDFVRFDEPGWAKMAMDLRARPGRRRLDARDRDAGLRHGPCLAPSLRRLLARDPPVQRPRAAQLAEGRQADAPRITSLPGC